MPTPMIWFRETKAFRELLTLAAIALDVEIGPRGWRQEVIRKALAAATRNKIRNGTEA